MRSVLAILLFLIFSSVYSSKNLHSAGARSPGMGNASVTLGDAWSCFNNQAGLDLYRKYAAGFSYENKFLLKELGTHFLAASIPVRGGTFGLSASAYGFSLYRENKYGLAFSKAFGEILSFGVQLDYFRILQPEDYGNKNLVSAEFGIISRPAKKLFIGMHVFNPVRSRLSADDPLPVILKAGARYVFSEKVFAVLEAGKNMVQPASFKAGFEYTPVPGFFVRAGVSTGPVKNYFGAGWQIKSFVTNLAFSWHSVLGPSPQLSLNYEFR